MNKEGQTTCFVRIDFQYAEKVFAQLIELFIDHAMMYSVFSYAFNERRKTLTTKIVV